MFKTRIGIISVALGACFGLVLLRLAQLQIVRYERYRELASGDALARIVPAPRGTIYDRGGNELAVDRAVYDISVRIERVRLDRLKLEDFSALRARFEKERARDPQFAKVLLENEFDRMLALLEQETYVRSLAGALQREPLEVADGLLKAFDTVARNWATPRTPLRIVTDVDEKIWLGLRATHEDVFHDSALMFGKAAKKLVGLASLPAGTEAGATMAEPPFPGLVCTISTRRVYPHGRFAAFVLGTVGELSASDEEALKADGILVDNARARHDRWERLRDSLDSSRADSLERILRVHPQELHDLSGLYGTLSKLRPGELQAVSSLGLAETLRWLERPARIQLTETENLWLFGSSHNALPGRLIGEMGVEAWYNDRLRGKHGMKIRETLEAKADDDSLAFRRNSQPREGDPMALTLSLAWQKAVERALKSQDRPGSAIVMDIHNGEILALASWPDFDPNLFAPPRDNAQRQEQLRAVLSDPAKPLLNRAISEQYPLGSCMKALIAAVALDLNLVTTNETFECSGYIVEGGQKFHCDDGRAHGTVNLLKAIRCSCNVTFHQIGARIGVERLGTYAKAMFGRRLGIDLTREVCGIYPDREWRTKAYPNTPSARIWTKGNDFQLAIGQGQFACTVLQALVMMSAVGNGGQVVTPHLWLDGPAPSVFLPLAKGETQRGSPRALGISRTSLAVVRQGLEEVVNVGRPGERGTAYSPFHEQGPELAVRVAGKTSSAEHKKGAKTHAWFVGYAPADNPQIAFAVMLEEAGHGGSVAAPLVYRILREIYGTRACPIRSPGSTPQGEPVAANE